MSNEKAPQVPRGWEAIWDSNYSRYYFYADSTGESVWEVPKHEAAASASLPGGGKEHGSGSGLGGDANYDNRDYHDRGNDRGRNGGGSGAAHQRGRSRSRSREREHYGNDGYGNGGGGNGGGGEYSGGQQRYHHQGHSDHYGRNNGHNNNMHYQHHQHHQHHQQHHHQQQHHQQRHQHQRQQNQNQNRRQGDWDCPQCNAHNYASKIACYKCRIPKPRQLHGQSQGYGQGQGHGQGGGHHRMAGTGIKAANVPLRPGDWNCMKCKAHNFARNTQCFRCRAPVQPGQRVGDGNRPGYESRSGGGGGGGGGGKNQQKLDEHGNEPSSTSGDIDTSSTSADAPHAAAATTVAIVSDATDAMGVTADAKGTTMAPNGKTTNETKESGIGGVDASSNKAHVETAEEGEIAQ